jgi:hypothetical protein
MQSVHPTARLPVRSRISSTTFDKADTDGDGKVSFQEAMNYQQKTAASGSSPSSASDASSASSNDLDTRVMMQIMKLFAGLQRRGTRLPEKTSNSKYRYRSNEAAGERNGTLASDDRSYQAQYGLPAWKVGPQRTAGGLTPLC